MEIVLPAQPPFSLHSIIHSHGWIQLAPFQKDEATGGFKYITQLKTGRVLELRFREIPGRVTVEVEDQLDEAERVEVERQAAWMLGLEAEFARFYELAKAEPKLAHVVERAQGRILRSATLFEDVLKTILTTNTLWAATIRMNQNVVQQFGAPLPGDSNRRAFPTPHILSATDEATLRSETRLGYRAPYVLGLARQADSGELDLEALKYTDLPTLELRKQLMAIKGVGPYAAANLLMLLGHYDYIPVDSWAVKMVSNEWYGGGRVGPAEVEAAFAHWGEFKGLAYWLWNWSEPG